MLALRSCACASAGNARTHTHSRSQPPIPLTWRFTRIVVLPSLVVSSARVCGKLVYSATGDYHAASTPRAPRHADAPLQARSAVVGIHRPVLVRARLRP